MSVMAAPRPTRTGDRRWPISPHWPGELYRDKRVFW